LVFSESNFTQGRKLDGYPVDIMLQDFLLMLVLAFIVFELIEHVLAPIVWFLLKGRKKSKYGIGDMKGKTVQIKSWDYKSGIVLFHSERWQAESDKPMQPGEKAIVEEIIGLKLRIKPYRESPDR
jgi:membrane-bound ClpP family serine protease